MLIGNKYKVESEPMNIILSEKKVASTGKHAGEEIWSILGYYGTPKEALNALLDMRVRKTGLTDLEKVVSEVESFRQEIKRLASINS